MTDENDDCPYYSRERILELLGLSAGPLFCDRGRTLHLIGRAQRGNKAAVRVGCDAWGCVACGHRKRMRFGVHLGNQFLYSLAPVAEEFVPPDRWNARRQQLFQREADYARIACPSGGWWLFHTAGDATCGTTFEDKTDAVVRLGERLRAIHPERKGRSARPVSLCRAWAMPDGPGDYELIGLLPVANPERLTSALKKGGAKMKASERDERSEWAVTYTLDDGAELVMRDGEPEVVKPEPEPNSSPYGETSSGIRGTVRPLFSVTFGDDGPALVVGPSR